MLYRLLALSLLAVSLTGAAVVTYDNAAQLCGWRIEVGDPVIVQTATSRFPAFVTGFWNQGVAVRPADPGVWGENLRFSFDQCHVVSRDDRAWRELTDR